MLSYMFQSNSYAVFHTLILTTDYSVYLFIEITKKEK